ncbi:MAG: hypothetical protein HFG80_11825 [Eubacterium sp.]|nr:hypothetical protein [Eubacterium sp.]
MELWKMPGKKVRIMDIDEVIYEGMATDYIYPEDNEPEVEAIIVDYPVRSDGYKYEYPVEFTAPEIKSIEIIS